MIGPIFGTGIFGWILRRFQPVQAADGLASVDAVPPADPDRCPARDNAREIAENTVRTATAHEYMTRYYAGVSGFSSIFSAEVAAALLKYQSSQGIGGTVGEIGVMKGRSFIALALHSEPGDICLAIDNFLWPEDVQSSFEKNCEIFGVDMGQVVIIEGDTRELTVEQISLRVDHRPIRYLHIDGDHSRAVLANDLELARQLMAPDGIICLDDMLHAQYPELALTVNEFFNKHPEWRVFCIVDRADIIAASKYLICQTDSFDRYKAFVKERFASSVFLFEAEFKHSQAVILSKDTVLISNYEELRNILNASNATAAEPAAP